MFQFNKIELSFVCELEIEIVKSFKLKVMSKSMDTKKEAKKEAVKSIKEKRAEKKEKKHKY